MPRQSGSVYGCSAGTAEIKRRDARGNADRDVEDIVDHDAGGGQKAGVHAEVFLGDRVGAAADRIGFDGLPVGDEQDRQQGEDDQHDRLERREPGRAGGGQDAERRFRSVCRRAQPIEPQRRDPFADADLVGAALPIGKRAAPTGTGSGSRQRPWAMIFAVQLHKPQFLLHSRANSGAELKFNSQPQCDPQCSTKGLRGRAVTRANHRRSLPAPEATCAESSTTG